MRRAHWAIWAFPIALLLIAPLPLPYSYYTLMRIVVCGTAGYLAFQSFKSKSVGWGISLGLLAVLFNPLIPVHLSKEIWGALDVGSAALLAIHWRVSRTSSAT